MKSNRFEVWAIFPDGIETRVETHKSLKSAAAAVSAMDHENERDLAEGYGFPHGVPQYIIVKA